MNKRVIWGAAACILIPYTTTLAWTGSIQGEEFRCEQQKEAGTGKRILLDRGTGIYYMDIEEYLPGVLARQIPVSYEPEAIKAQAIVARTYICGQMESEGAEEIAESALDMDWLEAEQLKKLWGTSRFPEYYKKLEEAVKATAGIVMVWEGSMIEPRYCRATAGRTRKGDSAHPYFWPVECPKDQETEGAVQLLTFSKEEFARKINEIPEPQEAGRTVSADQLPDQIQIGSRDESGYVENLQIGVSQYTGEEVQYALGLASSCFVLEPWEDGIRAVVKGIGHGYGLSQAEANERAKEGWKAEDILTYFYKNVAFISV